MGRLRPARGDIQGVSRTKSPKYRPGTTNRITITSIRELGRAGNSSRNPYDLLPPQPSVHQAEIAISAELRARAQRRVLPAAVTPCILFAKFALELHAPCLGFVGDRLIRVGIPRCRAR